MTRNAKSSFLLLALALAFCVARLGAASDAPKDETNLLANGSIEARDDGKPRSWTTSKWGGDGTLKYVQSGRTGKRSLMISSETGADIGWSTTIAVKPRSTYRLSGWIKTDRVEPPEGGDRHGRGALLNVHNVPGVATKAVRETSDWTCVETVFDSGGNDVIQINCLFGGWGLVTGTAWFDDLSLVCLRTEPWEPTISIDAEQKGHPISKYIYGQFIEHLGRCIYGGIWAEMLEDRKFYYPITPDYAPYGQREVGKTELPVVKASPWEIVGAEDAVTMIEEGSFVGDQTPLIRAGNGIRQNDLALVHGRKYVGYVWIKAAHDSAAITVTLNGADGKWSFACSDKEYTKQTFEFRATAATQKASLTIAAELGACYLGTVSLMPADNVKGMRADTLELLKALESPVYRWPGGNFVSGYDWKDGVGDRDRRPPRKNPAWTGVEHNDFGLDEFLTFCRLVDTEPYVAVNSGQGQVAGAVEELQYANGAADTPMGALRAGNGHPAPYKITWWGIGNEMYGKWQLGHMPLEAYIKKHIEFAEAMRAEDPSIKVIAVGATGRWSEGMMQHCADHMDLISEHFYCPERPGLASHVRQIADAVRRKADAHRDYRRRFDSLDGKDIDIALDEWNYWYGPHVFGELGTRYFLKDALGIAAGLNEYARQSDIMFMANYAQTVNVIGCIKTSKTDASMATTGLVLKLYREHFGQIPLKVDTESPLDVAAALADGEKTLTISVVNPTMQDLRIPLDLKGLEIAGTGKRWEIAGPDPMAYNEPGQPARVSIAPSEISGLKNNLSVAPCSVTVFRLVLR